MLAGQSAQLLLFKNYNTIKMLSPGMEYEGTTLLTLEQKPWRKTDRAMIRSERFQSVQMAALNKSLIKNIQRKLHDIRLKQCRQQINRAPV